MTSGLVFGFVFGFWGFKIGVWVSRLGFGILFGFQDWRLGFGAGPEASESKNTLEPYQRVQ